MSNRDRAWRRAQRDRVRQNTFKRLSRDTWRVPVPHIYHAYNLESLEDFFEYMKVDHTDKSKNIYVIGKGWVNPPPPTWEWYYGWWDAYHQPYNQEEVQKELWEEACKLADTPCPWSRGHSWDDLRWIEGESVQERRQLTEKDFE